METAHELGHIMGLNHEMQRTDRDTFVYYECTKLDGFWNALAKCQVDHSDCTARGLQHRKLGLPLRIASH